MAKFLTGHELNFELGKLLESAEGQIVLISPYIKLHERYASILKIKKDYPEIEIIIVFGKNEADISRSMKQEDFNFFKDFPNIEIRYEKRLHAKYYANESYAILTSMNLYDYSQDVNIEAGVMTKATMLGNITSNIITNVTGIDDFDNTAWTYFLRVIEQSELLFKKVPVYEKTMFGFAKKYITSKTDVDQLTEFFANRPKYDNSKHNFEKVKVSFVSAPIELQTAPKTVNSLTNVNSEIKFLSTTALSKEVGLSSKDLFAKFEKLNWIARENDVWILTPAGKSNGAQTRKGQYGEYIAWPDTIINNLKI